MITLHKSIADGAALVAEIERRSGQRVSDCYQCGRCTSTCTGAVAFDYPPHKIMRLLQLGQVEQVMASRTAQLCHDCMACSLRCPMNIDVADVIEHAKNLADERGVKDTEKAVRLFRRTFLRNVRRHGRLHEGSLLAWFNLRSGRPFNDLSLAALVLRKKKVHIFPPRIKNLRQVRRIFNEVNGTGRPK